MTYGKIGLGALLGMSLLSCTSAASAGREFFVDFEKGGDDAAGTVAAPWKRAPGDAQATGRAAATVLRPGDTVRFKGGVSYRGTIRVTAAGTEAQPISFVGTGFGNGKAIMDGTDPVLGAEKCASAAQCGGFPNWQDLSLVRLPPTRLKSIQLYDAAGPIFEAQWPTPRDPFYADNTPEWNTTPPEEQTRIESGRLRAPDLVKKLDRLARGSVLLWVYGNEFARRPILGIDGDDIVFDATGIRLYPRVPGRYAVTGNVGEPLPVGRFALLSDSAAVVNVPSPAALSVGVERSGILLEGASNVVIKGLQFRGQTSDAGQNFQSLAIANIKAPAQNLRIAENSFGPAFTRNGQGTVHLVRVTGVVIDNNDFERIVEGSGVRIVAQSRDVSVTNNRFNYLGRTAIGFLEVNKGVIDGNFITNIQGIHGNAISIYLTNRDIALTNNWVVNSARPVTFHGDKTRSAPGDHNIVIERNFLVATEAGLGAVSSWGENTRGVTITQNFLAGPKAGVLLNGSDTRVVVKGNVLTGIVIRGAAGADWQIGPNTELTWQSGKRADPMQACSMLGLPPGTAFGNGRC